MSLHFLARRGGKIHQWLTPVQPNLALTDRSWYVTLMMMIQVPMIILTILTPMCTNLRIALCLIKKFVLANYLSFIKKLRQACYFVLVLRTQCSRCWDDLKTQNNFIRPVT